MNRCSPPLARPSQKQERLNEANDFGRAGGDRHRHRPRRRPAFVVGRMRSVRNPVVRELIRNPKRGAGSHAKQKALARLREIKREIEEATKGKPRFY